MSFDMGGAASGALSGASTGLSVGGPWGAAIGAVAGGLISGLSGGAANDAAKAQLQNQKRLALLEGQKSLLNSILSVYEAQRIERETKLDTDYLGWATERQTKWLALEAQMDREQLRSKAAGRARVALQTAAGRGGDAAALAEAEAKAMEAKGGAQAAQLGAQTRLKAIMQNSEDAQALGLKRASFGARMVADSGSALEVLQREERMADMRQEALRTLGGMQVDDVQLEATLGASLKRMDAYLRQGAGIREALDSIDDQNVQVGLAQERADIETERKIALTEEEGWRTVMKMNLGSQNAIDRTMMQASNQMLQSVGSTGSAASYGAAASQVDATSLAKAGSSLLTSAADAYKSYKNYKAG